MDRKEFINSLREYLEGEVPSPIIEKNIRYYESYIAENGSTREEEQRCIEQIGEPHLIATTIITSYQMSGDSAQRQEEYYEEEPSKQEQEQDHLHAIPLKYKIVGVLSTAVLLLVLFFILRMFFFVAARVLFPILAIAIVFALVNKLFQR